MGVFIKQGVYWIDCDVNGRRKRKRIGPDKKLAEIVLKKRKVEMAEGKFLDKSQPITTIFDELATAYLAYSKRNKRSWDRDESSIKHLMAFFNHRRLMDITPASVERYKAHRLGSRTIYHRPQTPLPSTGNSHALSKCTTSGGRG
jgi:hypothetical protein